MSRLAFVLAAFFSAGISAVRFDNYELIDITPGSEDQISFLQNIEIQKDSAGETSNLDFQPQCVTVGQLCQALVSPSFSTYFKSLLTQEEIEFSVAAQNFQKIVDDEKQRIKQFQKRRSGKFDEWDREFHPYDEVLDWLKDHHENNPSFTELINIGTSTQGRDILAIRIGLNNSAPSFFYDGVIHAREWLATATVQYMINRMIEGVNNNDPVIMRLVEGINWYILPMFNPDGYVYSWTTNRNWRKTRSPNAGTNCVGTDPNRNADAGFGGPGTSNNPCSDIYRGPYAFSEPEVEQVCNYVLNNLTNPVGYNNIHANAQMLLSPYGYRTQLPADYQDHQAMHQAVQQAIRSVHGAVFRYGPISSTIYPASGGGTDWLYDRGVKYSIGWEVRGQSFAPPPSFIVTSGEEIWEGMKVFGERLIDEYSN